MKPISVGVSPTAATDTTVYTCPTGYYSLFTVMFIHNTGGSTKSITVQWYDASSNTTLDIFTALPVTSKEYIKIDGEGYIVLEEGDKIKITTESGSSFSFIGTFEQVGLTRT